MRYSPSGLADRLLPAPPDPARASFLKARDVAHRGLHGPGVPENSLAAADAAIAAGLAIECDVRRARDGTVIVFHDEDCGRLCGVPDRIDALDAAGIARLRLAGDAAVPTLAALLARIAGRVPLLIEIKTGHQPAADCLAVRHVLEGYRGQIAVMSFDPAVPRWFTETAPQIVRGLVVTERRSSRVALRPRLALRRSRAQFAAWDVRCLPSPLAAGLRARGLPLLAWTVRTLAETARARDHADRAIVERSPEAR